MTKLRRLWLDLGEVGSFLVDIGSHSQWQDHGLGLLRTILTQRGISTEMISVRSFPDWETIGTAMRNFDVLLMNVRSYTLPTAKIAARLFKTANPTGLVVVGGMHATVDPTGMAACEEFDRICEGAGENVIVELARDPSSFPRITKGTAARSMADWPWIDRRLWPNTWNSELALSKTWPLEPDCGWGPPPVATTLTSRVCPWACSFCSEASYIRAMERKPVDVVINELNWLDWRHGPIGSVVLHDSMFFMQPAWLHEWLDKYPRKANKVWPYWAAGRADTVRQWPELFEALVRETNWNAVSIGFESGSDRVLRTLNKECTADDNYFVIDLLNRIGDDMEAKGLDPPFFWSNIMFGVPGETQEDAIATLKMIRHTKRMMPSIAFYSPFPGSILGEQIIAEGKSLLDADHPQRYPWDDKMLGVDYQFYRDLLAGKHDWRARA